MATHSSVLAWRIPGTGEPGGLPSLGLHKSDMTEVTQQQQQQPSWSTRVLNVVLGCNLKNDRMISVCFQGKPFNITVIRAYAPSSNTEEAEVERFFEDLKGLVGRHRTIQLLQHYWLGHRLGLL